MSKWIYISVETHYLPDLFGSPYATPAWHKYKICYVNIFKWKIPIGRKRALY